METSISKGHEPKICRNLELQGERILGLTWCGVFRGVGARAREGKEQENGGEQEKKRVNPGSPHSSSLLHRQ
ncbi:MAG TPA: hypothetical protein VF758_01115, partial [Candidatus Acidoferrum sp.]